MRYMPPPMDNYSIAGDMQFNVGKCWNVNNTYDIATGLGVVRNLVVVTAADAVLAVGGRHGTLSEIGLALRMGRQVVTLSSWRVESDYRIGGPSVHRARDPREAAAMALRLAAAGADQPA